MGLTRDEWEKMWELTERLEHYVRDLPPHIGCKKFALSYVRFMKRMIQSVIGQQE